MRKLKNISKADLAFIAGLAVQKHYFISTKQNQYQFRIRCKRRADIDFIEKTLQTGTISEVSGQFDFVMTNNKDIYELLKELETWTDAYAEELAKLRNVAPDTRTKAELKAAIDTKMAKIMANVDPAVRALGYGDPKEELF